MVVPVETACPWRTKFIAALVLFAFAESIAYKLQDRGERLLGVGAFGLDGYGGALAGGEHHHAHDAFRIDPPLVARDPDLRSERARGLGELRRGARVQAQLVDDFSGGASHRSTGPRSYGRRLRRRRSAPSPPPRRAARRGARARAPASAGWPPRGPPPCRPAGA